MSSPGPPPLLQRTLQIVLVNQRCPQGDGHKHAPRQCRRRGTAQREKIPPWIRRHAALPLLVRRMLDSEVVAGGLGGTARIPRPPPYPGSNAARRLDPLAPATS